MSKVETGAVDPAISAKQESFNNISWKHFAPVVVTVLVALIPAPAGLPQYAWYYFANTFSSARSSWRRPGSARREPR
jgi:hypothetical protein